MLIAKIEKQSEADLDKYILLHPLLGKLILREMLYFTIHHNEHHLELLKSRVAYKSVNPFWHKYAALAMSAAYLCLAASIYKLSIKTLSRKYKFKDNLFLRFNLITQLACVILLS